MKHHSILKGIIPFCLLVITGCLCVFSSCRKDQESPQADPSENLALDSIVATKYNIVVWEEIYITAYARGQNLTYQWNTNHGSMVGLDSVTAKYWACYSCLGSNTVECSVSNEYGTISDTIVIHVTQGR